MRQLLRKAVKQSYPLESIVIEVVNIGEKAPDIELVDTDKKMVKLSEYKGKPTVLLFYPGAFTGVCTKEMCSFRDSLSKYNQLGVSVLGISVDSPFANMGFKIANNINFPLLSDYSRKTIKDYDIELQNFSGLNGYVSAKRVVYVLDKDHVVRYKWVGDSPAIEPDYNAVAMAAEKVK